MAPIFYFYLGIVCFVTHFILHVLDLCRVFV